MPRHDRRTRRLSRRQRAERALDLEALAARAADRQFRRRMALYISHQNRPAAVRRAEHRELHELHAAHAAAVAAERWRDARALAQQISATTRTPAKPYRHE